MPIRKSEGAAVGALVDMLKRAPPLSQQHSHSIIPSQIDCGKAYKIAVDDPDSISKSKTVQGCPSSIVSSGIPGSKTTADALEELRSYQEMKNVLLSQAGRPQLLASFASNLESMEKGTKR